MRSKNLSGASFVCYDCGHKLGEQTKQGGPRVAAGGQPRRQMAAVVFNKARRRHRADERRCNQPYAPQAATMCTQAAALCTQAAALCTQAAALCTQASNRRAPMSMRVLTPSVELAGTAGTAGLELLDTLQALGPDGPSYEGSRPAARAVAAHSSCGCSPCLTRLQALGSDDGALPGGTELLRLVPPRWNEQGWRADESHVGPGMALHTPAPPHTPAIREAPQLSPT